MSYKYLICCPMGIPVRRTPCNRKSVIEFSPLTIGNFYKLWQPDTVASMVYETFTEEDLSIYPTSLFQHSTAPDHQQANPSQLPRLELLELVLHLFRSLQESVYASLNL